MRWVLRLFKRLLLVVLVLVIALLVPVAYVETACRGQAVADEYQAILPEEHMRNEARTYLTYPEWHIVHAYDDYAKVIADGDPHDYGFIRSITGFWSSLCALSKISAEHGGFPWETKQMAYVVGVSFTAELAMKAAYEETVGRLFAMLRGADHSPLDDVSARQAADYAQFLQQVPWYLWDFERDIGELEAERGDGLRDRERRFAVGAEYSAKAAYADVIAAAVASTGADAVTLRMIVTGVSAQRLAGLDGVTVIGERTEGVEIETPRYRVLTHLLVEMAGAGADFVEIAGNDDIMITVISAEAGRGALFSFPRQGYGDYRRLEDLKVTDLARRLRALSGGDVRLEHVHDY